MFNNRMLAVAAVLVMAVPALGAATPIVVPPVQEQLVEGHTVFTVIEIVKATTTTQSRFAAAVAVLVREYQANQRAQRFPGVLWFNDQYLVNPTQSAVASAAFRYPCGGAVMAVNRGDPDPRVAIARVTAGTPGVDVDGTNQVPATPLGVGATLGETEQTYAAQDNWVEPDAGTYSYQNDYAWIGADPAASTVAVDSGAGPAGSPGVDVNGNGLYSDTVVGTIGGDLDANSFNATAPWDYRESYLITDPNDHSWVIDKYEFYTRDSIDGTNAHAADVPPSDPFHFAGDRLAGSDNVNNAEVKLADPIGDADGDGDAETEHWPAGPGPNGGLPPGGLLETEYQYPVWVVNMLGSPVFIPDGGNAVLIAGEFIGENCMPFRDLLADLTAPMNGVACGASVDNGNPLGTGADTDLTLSPPNPVAPFTDDPCMGYMEPSRNGFCYGGQDAADADGDGDVDKDDCLAERDTKPLRLYNALLYFKLDDLRVPGENRDHSDPVNSGDTNGCSDEYHTWDANYPFGNENEPSTTGNGRNTDPGYGDGTNYTCPNEDDNMEGNSHSFHPNAPVHEEREDCLPQFGGPNPTNHGGSTYINPNTRARDDGWYDAWTPCDYAHATRNIDIYFSPGGRPFPPTLRFFDVVDLEGSSAPFQDYHTAYPASGP